MTNIVTDRRLTTDEVQEFINDHVTYKPGWQLVASDCGFGTVGEVGVDIIIEDMIDTTAWGRHGRIEHFPSGGGLHRHVHVGTRADVEDQLIRLLLGVEEHESREFFRVDREAPYHPHRDDGERRWRRRTGA